MLKVEDLKIGSKYEDGSGNVGVFRGIGNMSDNPLFSVIFPEGLVVLEPISGFKGYKLNEEQHEKAIPECKVGTVSFGLDSFLHCYSLKK